MNKSTCGISSGYLNIFLVIIKMWKSITTGYHVFMLSKKVLTISSLLYPSKSLTKARIALK